MKFRFLFEGKVGWRRGSEIAGVYVRQSSDGGYNWGDVHKVDIAPYRLVWTRGSILEMLNEIDRRLRRTTRRLEGASALMHGCPRRKKKKTKNFLTRPASLEML
jgi:hypothetical protein